MMDERTLADVARSWLQLAPARTSSPVRVRVLQPFVWRGSSVRGGLDDDGSHALDERAQHVFTVRLGLAHEFL